MVTIRASLLSSIFAPPFPSSRFSPRTTPDPPSSRFAEGNSAFQWRHWGCTTAKQFENMKGSFDEAEELDGFEDLKPEDQERVKKAFEVGHGALRPLSDLSFSHSLCCCIVLSLLFLAC